MDPSDISVSISQILVVLKQAGAAAGPIFGLLWWLERSERLADRKLFEERAQKRDAALNELKAALLSLTAIFGSSRSDR